MSSGTFKNAYLASEDKKTGAIVTEQPIGSTGGTISDSGSDTLKFGETITFTDAYGTEKLMFDGPVTEDGKTVGFAAIDPNTGAIYVFSDQPIPQGTTLIVDQGDSYTICFMAGTQIATPVGTLAVDKLAVGDMVLTSDGAAKPVKWIGRQTISTTFADPLRVNPIRIAAGALDENMPVRDLLVSPDHALLIDGVLVQASALVNGQTIAQERPAAATFIYYHVELDDHSLILAEGVAAETFVDNVDRRAFDNWEEHVALYPTAASVAEMDLPRAKSHRQLPASTRSRLMERATRLGFVAKAA